MYYDVTWQDKSLCLDEDPELFFPLKNKKGEAQVVEAKAFCQLCPVKMKCLEMAVTENLEYGVYGGLSEEDRQEWKHRYMKATRP